jgi:PPOX class probable F420-dependent enzyme
MQASELTALDRQPYITLETFRKTGVGVATPVWFALGDGRFYVFSEARAGKVKRLRNSARARIAPCNVSGRVRGAWWDARARVVADPADVQRAYAALHRKYGWKMKLTDLLSTLTGRIHKRAIIEIEALAKSAS